MSSHGSSRRQFLAGSLAVTMAGCVPESEGYSVDLVWGRYGLSEGRFRIPRAITIDADDQLYIVDKTGRIQVFGADGTWLRSWSTPESENGKPTGMAIQDADASADGIPKLLVADTHYYRMLVYSLDGTLIESSQIGGTAGHGPGEFAFVTDAVSDAKGCIYVGEYNASDRIQKFDPDGNFIFQWGGTGDEPGKFVRPQSLVIRDEVLWVADSCNHRIQRFDISDDLARPKLIDVWGGPGELPGQFFYPYDLCVMDDGTVLVVEYKNNRIQRLSADGTPIGIWGSPGFAPGMLNGPWGIVVDSANRIHVLDSYNHRVQRLMVSDLKSAKFAQW